MDSGQKIAPLFSVIIPLYNKADTIARTVRSVVAQTFNDWELIVVNDGSTDDSLSVAKQLSKDIPMRIIDKPNGGVSSARNAGAEVAVGRYIALIDGDDIWFPNHLALLADAIEKYPDVRFFGTGYERDAGKYLYYTIPWGCCHVRDVYSTFRYGQPIHTSTVAINRLLWLEIGGFDSRYSFYEDFEFFFRLGLHTKCCIVRKVSGRYMDDALMQATKKYRGITRMTRPHLAFIDDQIRNLRANPAMVSFAVTQFRLLLYGSCCAEDIDKISELIEEFPYVARKATMRCMRNGHFNWGYKMRQLLFTLNYKMRCHLITWRKHKNA